MEHKCQKQNFKIYLCDFRKEKQGLTIKGKYFSILQNFNDCIDINNFYLSKDFREKNENTSHKLRKIRTKIIFLHTYKKSTRK